MQLFGFRIFTVIQPYNLSLEHAHHPNKKIPAILQSLFLFPNFTSR